MPSFKDKLGREWPVNLDTATVARVKLRTFDAVDFWRAAEGTPFVRMGQSVEMAGRVLWLVCEPEAERRGVSPEDFARAMASETVFHAGARAVAEAAIDLMPVEMHKRARKQLKKRFG
jgi:hypothetical protein